SELGLCSFMSGEIYEQPSVSVRMLALKTLPEASGVARYNPKPAEHDTPREGRQQSPHGMTQPDIKSAFLRRLAQARDGTGYAFLHLRLQVRQGLPLCPAVLAAREARGSGVGSLAVHLDPMGLLKPLSVDHAASPRG